MVLGNNRVAFEFSIKECNGRNNTKQNFVKGSKLKIYACLERMKNIWVPQNKDLMSASKKVIINVVNNCKKLEVKKSFQKRTNT